MRLLRDIIFVMLFFTPFYADFFPIMPRLMLFLRMLCAACFDFISLFDDAAFAAMMTLFRCRWLFR